MDKYARKDVRDAQSKNEEREREREIRKEEKRRTNSVLILGR